MSCPDLATLWALAADGRPGDPHARSCVRCEANRRQLQQTRSLLTLASSAVAVPRSWTAVDSAVDEAITAAASSSFRGGAWRLLLGGAVVVAMLALIVGSQRGSPASGPDARDEEQAINSHQRRLLQGALTAVKKEKSALPDSQPAPAADSTPKVALRAKQVHTAKKKRTAASRAVVTIKGPRTLSLSGGVTLQLGANAVAERETLKRQLSAGRLGADAVTGQDVARAGAAMKPGAHTAADGLMKLRSGDAVLRGRKGLVLHAGTAKLKPQNNVVLLVSAVDVAVLNGAVLVERDDGSSVLLHAGESLRFERGARVTVASPTERLKPFGLAATQLFAKSADLLFLERAQTSLKQGRCGAFLFGLETLAFDAEEPTVRSNARIIKARCHDERLEPVKAAAEYGRYLRAFPGGEAAAEARAALSSTP